MPTYPGRESLPFFSIGKIHVVRQALDNDGQLAGPVDGPCLGLQQLAMHPAPNPYWGYVFSVIPITLLA